MVHEQSVLSYLLSSSSGKERLNYYHPKGLSLTSFCKWTDATVQRVAEQGMHRDFILCLMV